MTERRFTADNPPKIDEFFDQNELWVTAGGWISIADMTPEHRHNAAAFLLKRAAYFFGIGNHHIRMVGTVLWQALAEGSHEITGVRLRKDHLLISDVKQVFHSVHLEAQAVWEARQAATA